MSVGMCMVLIVLEKSLNSWKSVVTEQRVPWLNILNNYFIIYNRPTDLIVSLSSRQSRSCHRQVASYVIAKCYAAS